MREIEPTVGENGRKDAGRVVLANKKYRLAMTRNFTKGRNPASGLWIVTAFEREPLSKGRPQSSIAAPALARGRDLSTPQPAAAKDNTPDWKKDLSKHKGKLSQGSKGDFFPEQRLIARWKNADRSTLLHESGHAFFFMEMGAAAEHAKIDER